MFHHISYGSLLFFLIFMTSCSLLPPNSQDIAGKMQSIDSYQGEKAQALFAGGCFWCVESAFEELDGVIAAISGFAGGEEANPTYEQVSSGATSHLESVLVIYDPQIVSYADLLDHFWKQIDPTDDGGSFVDRGYQYTSAIFYENEEQKLSAEESKAALEKSGLYDAPIVTAIVPATTFYSAEEYHQDYYKKNPVRYHFYRSRSGRDEYLQSIWGKDSGH